jgi:hypothetical protein
MGVALLAMVGSGVVVAGLVGRVRRTLGGDDPGDRDR